MKRFALSMVVTLLICISQKSAGAVPELCAHLRDIFAADLDDKIQDLDYPRRSNPSNEPGVAVDEIHERALLTYLYSGEYGQIAAPILPKVSKPKFFLTASKFSGRYEPDTKAVFLPAKVEPDKFSFSKRTLVHEFTHHALSESHPDITSKENLGYEEFLCELAASLMVGYRYVAKLDPSTWKETEAHKELAPVLTFIGQHYQQLIENTRQKERIFNAALSAVSTEIKKDHGGMVGLKNTGLIKAFRSEMNKR